MTTSLKKPIRKVLVANRGEIAVRALRACREMRIPTVAVCSEADRHAMHAQMADEAVEIGPPPPLESYLCIDKILDVARRTGADAIHPGYGFLAENAEFSTACADAGVKFIGPSAAVISSMGEKTAARAIMEKAQVPVVPGALLPAANADGEYDAAAVRAVAEQVGFPVMVKAAFGGGGKGMRLVEDPAEIVSATAAASREARNAFGDGTVYLEKFIARPRHVEFQIFGDAHGNAVHLMERECSIQRRHQKIIEETPSPVMTPELRERMGEAAVLAAKAVSYEGAGTVEFLLGEDSSFYFLEMNTRLQVEHPVTELITGQDLVRTQIVVAGGEPLPWRQEEIKTNGHAIECRVYAEDPENGFLPSLGEILLLHEPSGPGVRIDSGIRQGDEVTMHYDPMIAKLSLHAAGRDEAIDRSIAALRDYAVLGVTTNVEYLITILDHPEFRAGNTQTGFIPEYLADWQRTDHTDETGALVAASIDELARLSRQGMVVAGDPGVNQTMGSFWNQLGRFRIGGLG